MVYLIFAGGNGLVTSLGVLAIIMPRELLIAVALALVLTVLSRNPILSMNISLVSAVPIAAWFLEKSVLLVLFSIVLILIMALNFLLTSRGALVRVGSKKNLSAEFLRRGEGKRKRQATFWVSLSDEDQIGLLTYTG